MIAVADLENTARAYLRAARMLNRKAGGSPDASVYLCGYAVEIALKARTRRTLGWLSFPETAGEFSNYRSFQTHSLDVLLHLAGQATETRIRGVTGLVADWSVVQKWKPEQRYNPVGTKTQTEAAEMAAAVARILRVVL